MPEADGTWTRSQCGTGAVGKATGAGLGAGLGALRGRKERAPPASGKRRVGHVPTVGA